MSTGPHPEPQLPSLTLSLPRKHQQRENSILHYSQSTSTPLFPPHRMAQILLLLNVLAQQRHHNAVDDV